MNQHDQPPDAGVDLEALLRSCREEPGFREILELDRIGPYRVERFLGSGGMGLVYEAHQTVPLQRTVAIKLIKVGMDTRAVVARFGAERQALALMDHPNIARVFDAGENEDGRPYFVMEYVDGVPVTAFCDRNRLSVPDRLRLFQAVCRGVQHAHQKGIIHRDLKPSNVLVVRVDGRAVPKIIDFGIAKAIDQRQAEWTLATESGQMVGTPEYMSPEQADPVVGDVDMRTDIYSLGVILYELLAGALPLDLETARRGWIDDLRRRIRDQEPPRLSTRFAQLGERGAEVAKQRHTDVRTLTRQLRGELEWIVMRALAREPDRRYAAVSELEADVERHLNLEPVQAGPPSTRYRVKKFVQKHRVGFAIATVVMLLLMAGVIVSSTLYLQAEARAREIVRLADLHRLTALGREAETELWPAHPDRIPAMEQWMREVEDIMSRRPLYERSVAELATRVSRDRPSVSPGSREQTTGIVYAEQCLRYRQEALAEIATRGATRLTAKPPEQLRKEIDTLKQSIAHQISLESRHERLEFEDPTDQWQYDVLARLVKATRGLRSPEVSTSMLACVKKRIDDARRIQQASLAGPAAKKAWREAIQDIARLEVYRGLPLKPQFGLVPLGRDPHSGLWEFWHVPSGKRPRERRDTDPAGPSRWILEDDTGMVLVLVPGGRFRMGAVRTGDSGRTNVDLSACPNESPEHEVELAPFFLSKFETTQGQWIDMMRRWFEETDTLRVNHSYFKESLPEPGPWTLLHPVEQVRHSDAAEILRRWGLRLPTEAQWEYAARAGTTTPWWTGKTGSSLKGAANLADLTLLERRTGEQHEAWSDGYWGTAPVGRFPPNPWGLHDMLGNVSEWCRDGQLSYDDPTRRGDGLRLGLVSLSKVQRGGSWKKTAPFARSAYRGSGPQKGADIGFRAARSIE